MTHLHMGSAIKSVKTSAVIRKKDGRVINCGVISHQRKSLFARFLIASLNYFKFRG